MTIYWLTYASSCLVYGSPYDLRCRLLDAFGTLAPFRAENLREDYRDILVPSRSSLSQFASREERIEHCD
jgi:hypothetical protein